MPKALTTTEFIDKSSHIHKNKYNYTKTSYINNTINVTIICPIHGKFNQKPANHLQGKGCPKCKGDKLSKDRAFTTNTFITKSNITHHNKYDYTKTTYINMHSPIIIICPIHGEFKQYPMNHIKGHGCKKCAIDNLSIKYKSDTKNFIRHARNIHGITYDYSHIIYINARTKVKIKCKKHGIFEQTPNHHLSGQGCPNCSESVGESKIRVWLEAHNILFSQEHIFNTCKNIRPLPFDFYIPSHNTCIEFDGKQHYTPINFTGHKTKHQLQESFNIIQYHDNIKTTYCYDNNIRLIRIPYFSIKNIDNILNKSLLN